NLPRIGITRVTVDGGDTTLIGAVGAALQVSQDAVQEFQISTVNFDLSTGLTTDGAINIVTRSGGNNFHGSGFYFYRDHNLAAYPGLQRDASNPDPSFNGNSSAFRLAGPCAKTGPSSSRTTSATTSEECFQFSRALRTSPRSEESLPVLFSATSSMCA